MYQIKYNKLLTQKQQEYIIVIVTNDLEVGKHMI